MEKKVGELSSEEIKDAVRDAYENLASKTESEDDNPQTVQSSCCGSSSKPSSTNESETK
ncbi:MAG: hypothetical protein ACFFF4_07275 [Candidatus Thorarchaeota archaeon]